VYCTVYTHVLQGSFSVIVEAWHDNTGDGPSQGTITPFYLLLVLFVPVLYLSLFKFPLYQCCIHEAF